MDTDCKKNITFSVDESNYDGHRVGWRRLMCGKQTQGRSQDFFSIEAKDITLLSAHDRERDGVLGRGSHPSPTS